MTLDAKALELACDYLSEWGSRKECNSCYSKVTTGSSKSWLGFLRQKAGEAA